MTIDRNIFVSVLNTPMCHGRCGIFLLDCVEDPTQLTLLIPIFLEWRPEGFAQENHE